MMPWHMFDELCSREPKYLDRKSSAQKSSLKPSGLQQAFKYASSPLAPSRGTSNRESIVCVVLKLNCCDAFKNITEFNEC